MAQRLAFVFPGQGSQSVGMLDSFIAENQAIVLQTCAQASEALGYDIAKLIADDPQQLLNQTQYTQPALLTAGVIAWRIWQNDCDTQPNWLAGHSLGEYTALVCANALSFAEGLRLVAKRGELMQQAVASGVGAMAAILGLDMQQVHAACVQGATVGGVVQTANINAPGQIVIAGNTAAVAAAINAAKDLGAKRAIMLPVSVPSHCALMLPAAQKFATYLQAVNWQTPTVPVVQNFDVLAHSDAPGICAALQEQLCNPVRWVEIIEYFVQQGATEIYECGPGKVLTGLNKRIAPTLGTVLC